METFHSFLQMKREIFDTGMGGSPGDVSEHSVKLEKRKKGWRMSCDVGEVTVSLENELCYYYELCSFSKLSVTHLRHSSFSNPSVALPTSQFILQPFRCFVYVTAHSPTLLSLFLRHRLFTYVTWRTANDSFISCHPSTYSWLEI